LVYLARFIALKSSPLWSYRVTSNSDRWRLSFCVDRHTDPQTDSPKNGTLLVDVQTDDSVESLGLRMASPERLQRQGGVHHLEQLASASSQSAAIPVSACTVQYVIIGQGSQCVF